MGKTVISSSGTNYVIMPSTSYSCEGCDAINSRDCAELGNEYLCSDNECIFVKVEQKQQQPEEDVVNAPKHYQLNIEGTDIEVRDICRVMANRLAKKYSGMFVSDYVQMLQYNMRFDVKNGLEDLLKSRFYLDELIKGYPNEDLG